MNDRQRIVLVVAAATLAISIDRAVISSAAGGSWFGYAPNTDVVFTPGIDPGRQLLIRLALLAAWSLLAMRLLRDRE
jgi:hypothetical protein